MWCVATKWQPFNLLYYEFTTFMSEAFYSRRRLMHVPRVFTATEELIRFCIAQPMIQYINKKDIYGPFHKRTEVYLPHSAEVTSDKYTNM